METAAGGVVALQSTARAETDAQNACGTKQETTWSRNHGLLKQWQCKLNLVQTDHKGRSWTFIGDF